MNSLLEKTEYCISTFIQIVCKLSSSMMSLILNTFGVSSETVDVVKPNDDLMFVIDEYYKKFIDYLAFDEFQLQLLRIFLTTLFILLVLICLTWYIYGKRIIDRFMNRVMNNLDSHRKSFRGDT